jgi:NAD-dependent dihydropyrimidine dehydrogenase PreA subunit
MVFHPEKCISCGACAKACPANAIKFFPKGEDK